MPDADLDEFAALRLMREFRRWQVLEWIAKYREGGLAAISTKIASDRPTALDDSEMIRRYARPTARTRGPGGSGWLCGRGRGPGSRIPPG